MSKLRRAAQAAKRADLVLVYIALVVTLTLIGLKLGWFS